MTSASLSKRQLFSLSLGVSVWGTLSACAGAPAASIPPESPESLRKGAPETTAETPEENTPAALSWAESSFSPRPGSSPEPSLEQAEKACGVGDAALHEVAQFISELHATEGESPGLDVVKFHLRRVGSPYVMPRMWSAEMQGITDEQVTQSVKEWSEVREPLGQFRCGLGLTRKPDGSQVVTVLQADVLAEVLPVPTQVSSGTWINFQAQLLSSASSAAVVLLPPEGRPRQLTTDLQDGRVSARFSIETEGTWLIQLMATQAGGPRPVAQVLVTADVAPPSRVGEEPVPGETAFDEKLPDADALFSLMNAARKDQGLPELRRNRTLDRAAAAHTKAMVSQGRISHNTGAGDPAYRVQASGLRPKATGENVALAGSVVRLHRVLWASPAHRENLLLRRWDETGVFILDDGSGSLYATQLFIDSN